MEEIMKPARVFAVIGLFLLLAGPSLHAACTSATAAGTFGFTTTGILILPAPTGPVPVGAVGSITVDLNGNAAGSQDRSLGGAFAHETLTGTLTVNRDCTISLLANVFDSSGNLVRTSTIDGVLVNNGKQIRAIFETVVLANGVSLGSVLTVDANRVQGHAQ